MNPIPQPSLMRLPSQLTRLCLIGVGCLVTCLAQSLELLSVQVPAQYESGLAVPDSIRKDCIGLDLTVGVEVAYQLEKSGFATIDRAERINLKRPGKVLALSITQAAAMRGQWTDPKSLTVKAELFQDGKPFEWVIRTRTSRAQTGVCETLEKNAQDIAIDIHKWLMTAVHSKTLPGVLSNDAAAADPNITVRQLQARTLLLNSDVKYSAASPRPQLIDDCKIEESLIDEVQTTFSKSLTLKRVKKAADAEPNADVLQFTIVSINGSADDSLQSSRGMTLKAELLHDGIIIDTFSGAHTTERGRVFGQVLRNTCDALNGISKSVANDTYQWYLKRNSLATKQSEVPKPAPTSKPLSAN